MKKLLYLSVFLVLLSACKEKERASKTLAINTVTESANPEVEYRELSQEFKDYWYAGKAEITSYTLAQERYGELREGTAVNIFVSEDFLPEAQVKADRQANTNIPVLKLNSTKKFLTGIYPYSVMTSTFSPTTTKNHAIKVSHSMQEWCGHVYLQLNNRKKFELTSHSYFQGEADQETIIEKAWLENELWNLIRINPEELPTGEIKVIPALENSRMGHRPVRAYHADAILEQGDNVSTYKLSYPSQKRNLTIHFNSSFPFEIERWEETHPNGLQTTAVKNKRIRTAYWGQNSNKDIILRDSLGLK